MARGYTEYLKTSHGLSEIRLDISVRCCPIPCGFRQNLNHELFSEFGWGLLQAIFSEPISRRIGNELIVAALTELMKYEVAIDVGGSKMEEDPGLMSHRVRRIPVSQAHVARFSSPNRKTVQL